MSFEQSAGPYFYTGSVIGAEGQQGHFAAAGVNQSESAAAITALANLSGGNFEVSEETGVMSMPVPAEEVDLVREALMARGNVVHARPFEIAIAEDRLGFRAVDRILGR